MFFHIQGRILRHLRRTLRAHPSTRPQARSTAQRARATRQARRPTARSRPLTARSPLVSHSTNGLRQPWLCG